MDLFEIIPLKTALLIPHVFGVALGAGGAFMSDAMFMSSVKDGRFSRTEARFLKLASILIWSGLGLLAASGVGLFLLDPATYGSSGKFLAKMTVIAVIVLNGAVFHFWHFPLIHRHVEVHFSTSDEFMRKRAWVMASGAISMTSWSSAIVLGMLKNVPWSYAQIMSVYLGVVCFAMLTAIALRNVILKKG